MMDELPGMHMHIATPKEQWRTLYNFKFVDKTRGNATRSELVNSLVTVTELTPTGVMMTARGQTLSSVCDFTYCFWIWIEVSHNIVVFLHVRDLENMVM